MAVSQAILMMEWGENDSFWKTIFFLVDHITQRIVINSKKELLVETLWDLKQDNQSSNHWEKKAHWSFDQI